MLKQYGPGVRLLNSFLSIYRVTYIYAPNWGFEKQSQLNGLYFIYLVLGEHYKELGGILENWRLP